MARHTSADTRADLLAAATVEFTARGLRGTSLADIAKAAGYSKATVLYQFESKEHLVREWAKDLLDGLDVLVQRATALPTVAERSQAAMAGFIDLALRHRQTLRLMQAEISYILGQEAMSDVRALETQLRRLLRGSSSSAASDAAAIFFIGGVAAVVAELTDVPEADSRRILLDLAAPLLTVA
ncbi:TetR family transcriptional regulator [Actinoplanes sp. NPDC026619]|uniref:TetR/AcrR family transcriptional regulator n=1 Tax=Actinoplanes sp. NPDC026619 TaxID=3155798 RepID=UPI0033DF9D7B